MVAAAPPPVRVLAAVVRRGEALLLARRPRHKRHGGLWELPGGKVEPGEDDATAIARELDEELGVAVISVGCGLGAHQDPGSPYLIVFIEVEIAGEPQALEHEAVGFFGPAEARALVAAGAVAPSDARFLSGAPAWAPSPDGS